MFLRRPDEKRLWVLVAGLLGSAIVLLLLSLQAPWFTATFTVSDVETRGLFDFREAAVTVYSSGEPLDDPYRPAYGDDSAFGGLMGRTEVLIGLGIVGAGAVAGLAYLHRSGRYSSPALIRASWIAATGGLVAGLAYFTLNAGRAGADEVFTQLSVLAGTYGYPVPPGPPTPRFWGTQTYLGGELASAPGVGWLLALLGLANLVVATLLLYRFPAPEPARDEAADAGFQPEPAAPEAAPEPSQVPTATAFGAKR